MSLSNNRFDHFMRLGVTAEIPFFVTNKDKYDTVVLNGTSTYYFGGATASLMATKLNDKKYFIDPVTHAFGHNFRYITTTGPDKTSKVKASIEGLANEYGSPITKALAKGSPVVPADFSSKDEIKRFSKKVIEFQSNFLINAIDKDDRKYFTDGDLEKILLPCFVIAPYFYMESGNIDKWLDINIQLVEASKNQANQMTTYAEIVIDRGILDIDEELVRVANAYSRLDCCDGFLLWISDFSEHEIGVSALSGFRKFIKILSRSSKPIINLYGGYFSLLLADDGLTGICHGPGYGENRDVVPVGGGLPTSKFYLNPVHHRLKFTDVQFMVNAKAWANANDFYKEICSGPLCKSVLAGDLDNFYKFGIEKIKEKNGKVYSYPTTEARILTTQHYLEAKAREFIEAVSMRPQDLIRQLQEAKKKYQTYLSGAQLRYLDLWVQAIQKPNDI